MALKYTAVFGFNQYIVHDALQIFDKAVCDSSINAAALWPLILLCAMLMTARNMADRTGPCPSYDQV